MLADNWNHATGSCKHGAGVLPTPRCLCQDHKGTAALSAGMGVRNITPVPPIMHQKRKLHGQSCPAVSIKGEIQGYFCVMPIFLLSPVHSAFLGRLCWGSLLKATAFHLCDIRAEFPVGLALAVGSNSGLKPLVIRFFSLA